MFLGQLSQSWSLWDVTCTSITHISDTADVPPGSKQADQTGAGPVDSRQRESMESTTPPSHAMNTDVCFVRWCSCVFFVTSWSSSGEVRNHLSLYVPVHCVQSFDVNTDQSEMAKPPCCSAQRTLKVDSSHIKFPAECGRSRQSHKTSQWKMLPVRQNHADCLWEADRRVWASNSETRGVYLHSSV